MKAPPGAGRNGTMTRNESRRMSGAEQTRTQRERTMAAMERQRQGRARRAANPQCHGPMTTDCRGCGMTGRRA